MHTTVETAHKDDIDKVIDLMYEFLVQLEAGHDFSYTELVPPVHKVQDQMGREVRLPAPSTADHFPGAFPNRVAMQPGSDQPAGRGDQVLYTPR